MVASGLKDREVVDKLDISWDEFRSYKRDMYAAEMLLVSQRDPTETFIDYKLTMEGVCDDLKEIEKGAKKVNQFGAAMGAAKARAQIIDNTINRGQEMGIIPRAAKRHEHVGGLLVATMSDTELMEQLATLNKSTQKLLATYGDDHFLELAERPIYEEAIEVSK